MVAAANLKQYHPPAPWLAMGRQYLHVLKMTIIKLFAESREGDIYSLLCCPLWRALYLGETLTMCDCNAFKSIDLRAHYSIPTLVSAMLSIGENL